MKKHHVHVEDFGSFEIEEGAKLAYALEECGVDVSHRCGGQAKCTTCNVHFYSDEPSIGDIERTSLEEDGVLGQFRLSCQIRVDRPMHVKVLTRVSEKGWDPGKPLDP
jgi:ferredoxin